MLHTAVGQGLFDFGHVDGPADQALLQHPLGVLRAARRRGAGRRHLQRRGPPLRPGDGDGVHGGRRAGRAERPGAAPRRRRRGRGRVGGAPADPARARRAGRGRGDTVASGTAPSARRPCSRRARSTLDVIFTPAPGQKLDESFGPSTRLEVSASPPELLLEGAGDRHRAAPPAGHLAGRRRGRAAGRRAGRDLRRRRRAPRLPPDPAGLGRADPGRRPTARRRLPLVLRGLDATARDLDRLPEPSDSVTGLRTADERRTPAAAARPAPRRARSTAPGVSPCTHSDSTGQRQHRAVHRDDLAVGGHPHRPRHHRSGIGARRAPAPSRDEPAVGQVRPVGEALGRPPAARPRRASRASTEPGWHSTGSSRS